MICPYCGVESYNYEMEHFFPQSLVSSKADFQACKQCNNIKRSKIVYPHPALFKAYPFELKMEKFQKLWNRASLEKYLYIVPYWRMREAFDNRRWVDKGGLFTIEERKFYGLDHLKDIYEFSRDMMESDANIRALVMSYTRNKFYLIHTYQFEFSIEFNDVESMNIDKYYEYLAKGARVLGDGAYGLYRYTTDYTKYFQWLLNAPYTKDMLGD